MLRAFSEHPESVGETYLEHLGSAWSFAAAMAVGAVACLLHGLFPFAFRSSGSRRICELHDRMVVHRSRLAARSEAPASLGPQTSSQVIG